MSHSAASFLWRNFPSSLTILPTYRCNAACEQCCFESNPNMVGRLSLDEIQEYVTSAKLSFPQLKLIVFSGGECFLLKEDLYKSVAHCTSLGLATRIVTNGFWGKSKAHSDSVAKSISVAGLGEINFSTGPDHAKFVPLESVINAAVSSVSNNISTVITVEEENSEGKLFEKLISDERVEKLQKQTEVKFLIQRNIWMGFNKKFDDKRESNTFVEKKGCDQLFTNLVITPHKRVSSCCGLTFEYIPEMKIGSLSDSSIREIAERQIDDAAKIWNMLDGPQEMMRRSGVTPDRTFRHICEACLYMHSDQVARIKVRETTAILSEEILARLHLREAFQPKSQRQEVV